MCLDYIITISFDFDLSGRPGTYTTPPLSGCTHMARTLADLAPPTWGVPFIFLYTARSLSIAIYFVFTCSCLHILVLMYLVIRLPLLLSVRRRPCVLASPSSSCVVVQLLCRLGLLPTPHMFPRHCSRATAAASFSFYYTSYHRHTVPSQQCSVTPLNILILGNTS
jgi:hypothetical protein